MKKENFIAHYGVKGQRWGVRRYQNYDGTRIKSGDRVLSKGRELVRYTADKNERKNTYGKYASTTRMDTYVYREDAINNRLGFKTHDAIWTIRMNTISDARIRSGKNVVEDVLSSIGDQKLNAAFETLDKVGFYDSSKSSHEKSKIWMNDKDVENARKLVASSMNKYVKENKESMLKKYKGKGYDAIVDPEDYSWNYEMPLILINDKKFKETSRTKIKNEEKWRK